MLRHKPTLNWIFRLGLLNAIIIIYLRAGLVYQPLLFNFFYESHGNKEWVKKIKDEIGDMPVVFENSYRNTPMYGFYSGGIPAFSLNNVMYRKNQYSIDDSEEKVRGKKILYVSPYINDGTFHFTKAHGAEYHAKFINDFQSFRKLECIIEDDEISINSNKEISLQIVNPYPFAIDLEDLKFAVAYLNSYKNHKATLPVSVTPKSKNITKLLAKDTTEFKLILPKINQEKIGYFRVVISENNLYYGLNSKPIQLR